MVKKSGGLVILVADDDEDDCFLIRDALVENGFTGDFRFVLDGRELMEALLCGIEGECSRVEPKPDLILLDLNMPKKDGREALREIKANPELNKIPVVVLTTSGDRRDIELCRRLGASSFITKPMSFHEWISAMGTVCGHLSGAGSHRPESSLH